MTTTDWVEVPFRALKEHGGMRVDAYLALRLKRYSREQVRGLIKEGRVSLRGGAVKPAARVAEGETVLIRYPRREEPPPAHEALRLVFQDDAIAAIDKPAGVLSHPTDKILRNTVTSILSKQLGRKVYLCHRLDRETSGVMILALSSADARVLDAQFRERRARKEYLAVVFGRVAWDAKRVDAPLGAEGGEIVVRRAVAGHGQTAVTEFERLATDGRFSLVRARPRTGRLHQVRAHLAHLGHPVVGDKLYNDGGKAYLKAVRRELSAEDRSALGAERQLLHAWRLELDHPRDGRPLRLEAPVPGDFPLRPPEDA